MFLLVSFVNGKIVGDGSLGFLLIEKDFGEVDLILVFLNSYLWRKWFLWSYGYSFFWRGFFWLGKSVIWGFDNEIKMGVRE